MPDFLVEANQMFEYTQALRRDFHQHPELGFQEVRTAGIVARELNQLGLEVHAGIAQTGVVALLETGRPGSVLLLRFDMDALPINEETGASYASQTPGCMHACGHDGHTAIGLSVARLLHSHRDHLTGTVKFVFQPAEEGLGGAERMVAEGVLQNPAPDFALALHLWNESPLGHTLVAPGPVMAGAESFSVTIAGKGGHGALPHLSVDPILAASHIVTALQSIASRSIDPLDSVVVSVTAIHGGDAFNVIPPQVELKGTVRAFSAQVKRDLLQRFHEIVEGIATSMGCSAQIIFDEITPPVVNDAALAARIARLSQGLFPDDVLDTESRTMGSEDMAFMMGDIPGCFFFVGSNNSEKGLDAGHHHPKFDFDERALVRAVALMATAAADILTDTQRQLDE